MAANPISALAYLIEGIRLITRPGLRRFVALPLGINILVFTAALYWATTRFEELIAWLQSWVPTLPDWLAWLEQGLAWLLWPVFVLLAIVLIFQGFTLIANMIAAPFNGILAAKVAEMLGAAPPAPDSGVTQMLSGMGSALMDEMRKMLHAFLWAIPFFIFSLFVPLLGPAVWFAFTAWVMALEYLDYPMGNHGLGAREIRQRLRERLVLSMSFGAVTAFMTLIPIVNFIAMPSAVAGATVLWVKEFKKGGTSPLVTQR